MDKELQRKVINGGVVDLRDWMNKQPPKQLINVVSAQKLPCRSLVQRGDGIKGLHALVEYLVEGTGAGCASALKEVLKVYIVAGHKINEKADFTPFRRKRFGTTPLLYAIQSRKLALVEAFIACGADVNLPDSSGYTPLHWVVLSSSAIAGAFSSLVQAGAKVSAFSGDAPPLLHAAVDEGRLDIIPLILQNGEDVNVTYPYSVIKEEHWSRVTSRYHCGAVPKETKCLSAVGRAVRMRKIAVLQYLLREENAQVTLDDLHFCILEGDTKVACIIIAYFDDQTLANDLINGQSALLSLGKSAFVTTNGEDQSDYTLHIVSHYVSSGWSINTVGVFPLERWYFSTLLIRAVVENPTDVKLVQLLLSMGSRYDLGPTYKFKDDEHAIGAVQAAVIMMNLPAIVELVRAGQALDQPFGYFGSQLMPIQCVQRLAKQLKKFEFLDGHNGFPPYNISGPCPLGSWIPSVGGESCRRRSNPTIRQEILYGVGHKFPDSGLVRETLLGEGCISRDDLAVALERLQVEDIVFMIERMPKDENLSNLVVGRQNIPAMQHFFHRIRRQDLTGIRSNWTSVAKLIRELYVRGYNINDTNINSCSVAALSVNLAILPNADSEYSNEIFHILISDIPSVNWNVKSLYLSTTVNPLEWLLSSYDLYLSSLATRRCMQFCNAVRNPGKDYSDCDMRRFAKIAGTLCAVGANACSVSLEQLLRSRPCLMVSFPCVLKNLYWAGAVLGNVEYIVETWISTCANANDSTKRLREFLEWHRLEKSEAPSLFHLCSREIRMMLDNRNIKEVLVRDLEISPVVVKSLVQKVFCSIGS